MVYKDGFLLNDCFNVAGNLQMIFPLTDDSSLVHEKI